MGHPIRSGTVNLDVHKGHAGDKSEQRRTGVKLLGVVGTGAKWSDNAQCLCELHMIAVLEGGVGVSITSSYSREAGIWDVYVKFSA